MHLHNNSIFRAVTFNSSNGLQNWRLLNVLFNEKQALPFSGELCCKEKRQILELWVEQEQVFEISKNTVRTWQYVVSLR